MIDTLKMASLGDSYQNIKSFARIVSWPWRSPASPAWRRRPWAARPSRRWSRCSMSRPTSRSSPPSTWSWFRQRTCMFPPLCCEKDCEWGQQENKTCSAMTSTTCHHAITKIYFQHSLWWQIHCNLRWWQIQPPVIQADPVLKWSRVEGIQLVKNCCRLWCGQLTIGSKTLAGSLWL